MEVKIYDELKGNIGVPELYWSGVQYSYNIMAMELLGLSLDKLFDKCEKHFSIKTTLLIADQMLDRIENLHEHGFIYRDMKPEVYY